MKQKQVLIAHQTTIPHYRVAFYECVQQLRPSWWDFRVVLDSSARRRQKIYAEPVDASRFSFPIHPTRTLTLGLSDRKFSFQTFVFDCRQYDLVVIEDALHNLSYPLSRAWKRRDAGLAYWGHGRDTLGVGRSALKHVLEALKLRWAERCDGYFAYTEGVRSYLLERGVAGDSIFVLNNTIDVQSQRRAFEATVDRRTSLRREVGLDGRRVLLYVGRFDARKNLDFLGRAVAELRSRSPAYHLVVVGGGDSRVVEEIRSLVGDEGLTLCGAIVDRAKLAEWYVRSDAYVFPGDVGLGVVHALCYNLPPIVLDRPTHNPEYEYLSDRNAVIVGRNASVNEYADQIETLLSDQDRLRALHENAWPSIRHLTIESMAGRFVSGVSEILRRLTANAR